MFHRCNILRTDALPPDPNPAEKKYDADFLRTKKIKLITENRRFLLQPQFSLDAKD